MSLSSTTSIENAAQRSVSSFSSVKTMGSLVGNREFGKGFCELMCGQSTSKSYIWQALSAATEQLGEEVYSNVLHYIDNVSNVDVCKVKSLRSMLKLVGANYLVLDKIQHYPIEIQKLIDIMSVNKRYLLDNAFIKQSFIDDLLSSGAISNVTSVYELSDIEVNNGNISSNMSRYRYDQQAFDNYLSGMFYNFMYDMLDMEIVPDDQMCAFVSSLSNTALSSFSYDQMVPICKARQQITINDGYGLSNAIPYDKYLKQKKLYNISPLFDVELEVDKIELGQASLDDYYGDELSLLIEEINFRKSEICQLSNVQIANLMTRNAYYRKRKVIEYAKFIDSMVGASPVASAYQTYQYDQSYYLNPFGSIPQTYVLSNIGNPGQVAIVSADVAKAANTLKAMVNYIAKIREVIRLQVRKVFMKGTNNLLEYAINEFMIDYANQLINVFDIEQVSSFVSKLSAHSVLSVKVQEYWDHTEYFNISAATSNKYALNYKYVNDRYFDEVFQRDADSILRPKDDTGIFTNDEINEFYLSTLNMKNLLGYPVSSTEMLGSSGLSSNFYDFLSVLFDVAANPSYYDSEYDVFGSELSNQVITHDIYGDLQEVKDVSAIVVSAANKANFQFTNEQTILEQKDELFSKLETVLQDEYLSAVSATYDQYSPQVQQLSIQLDSQASLLSSYLGSQYSSYFCKSDNKYCYDEDGTYMFDYFVGNPDNDVYDTFITYLDRASEWIQQNCYTYALSVVLSTLSNNYSSIKSDIYVQVASQLTSYSDFSDLDLDDLSEEMSYLKSFIDKKVTLRTSFLQTALENFRSQASQLKTSYDQCAASFQNVLASMPDTSQGYYFKWNKDPSPDYYNVRRDASPPKDDENDQIEYDQYSQCIFQKIEGRNGYWSKVEFNADYDITESDTLKTNVNKALQRIDECQHIYYGFIGGSSSPSTTTSRSYGSQKESLNAILMTLNDMQEQLNKIVESVPKLFSVESDFNDISIGNDNAGKNGDQDVYQKILDLQSYLAIRISDADFVNDAVLSKLNSYLKNLAAISADYIPTVNSYDEIWSEFQTFLVDYSKTGDFKILKPSNLEKLDEYRANRDKNALNEINASFSSLRSAYKSLVDQFVDICQQNIELYSTQFVTYVYEYTNDALERCLKDIMLHLHKDVQIKISIGNKKIDDDMHVVSEAIDAIANGERSSGKVGLYRKYFPDELISLSSSYSQYEAAFNAQHTAFTDILQKLLDKLDYTRDQSFIEQRLMFQNYTGITAKTLSVDRLIAADPYYNHKNLTHPSYQIHPFLWKFSEKCVVQRAIDTIANMYANIDITELEGYLVQSNLDKYINQFGNVIDVWKNNTKDFTSYVTRYEQSNHICRYTNEWSEVVDYDGAFYPPALQAYRMSNVGTRYSSVSSWYSHLSVDYDLNVFSRISAGLENDFTRIQSITGNRPLSAVEDIFKYQLDTYGNMYILYKKYAKANPTYIEKLSASGQLWIRLADSPIALPLSSVANVSKSAIDIYQGEGKSSISQWDICDFEIVPTGSKICIAYRDYNTSLVKIYPLEIKYDMRPGAGIGDLWFSRGEHQAIPFPEKLSSDTKPFLSGFCNAQHYLGMYPRSVTETDAVYIDTIGMHAQSRDHSYVELSCILDDPTVHIYQVQANATSQKPSEIDATVNVSGIIGLNAPIAYYDTQNQNSKLDIAFVTKSDGSLSVHRVEQPEIQIELCDRPKGYIYDDPTHLDMNSFDVFNQTVRVATVGFSNQVNANVQSYQTNADMGYAPSYAGLSVAGPLSMANELNVSHQAVQLLGKSSDIDALEHIVNAIPDPYVTKQDVNNMYLYGRVWENGVEELSSKAYTDALDKSLNILLNLPFYDNMPTLSAKDDNMTYMTQWFSVNDAESCFMQDIDIAAKYEPNEMSALKVIAYGTQALGKNLYLISDLTAIASASQGSFMPVDYDYGKHMSNDISISLSGYAIKIAGTLNGIDEIDTGFLNTFSNVSAMQYAYADGHLKFKYSLLSALPTFIAPGTVRIAFVNINDIRFIEWFHLLDTGESYDDNAIPKELGRVTTVPISSSEMLAVDLSKYTELSDVKANDVSGFAKSILDTYNKMAFKTDESDIFPLSNVNYYIPSINVKYPLTFGQAYSQHYVPSGLNANSLVKIYKPDELYVIDAQDPSDIISAGDVELIVPFFDSEDEIRVFEDYWNEDTSLCMLNANKYCTADPQFYQYAHFFGTNVPLTGYDVPSQAISSISVEACYGQIDTATDNFSKFLRTSKSLHVMASEQVPSDDSNKSIMKWKDIQDSTLHALLAKMRNLLKLYFSYKKTKDGIVLYANYQNLLNSPFVKVADGKVYVDTIPGTYAKVLPGTSEELIVIVQFRQYFNGMLVSCKNVIAATYKIYNISDDKPKFLLRKISGPAIEKAIVDNLMVLTVYPCIVPSGNDTFQCTINLANNTSTNVPVTCVIGFDMTGMQLDDNHVQTVKKLSDGTFQAKFTKSMPQHTVYFVKSSSAKAKTLYPIDIIAVQADTAEDIETHNGYVQFA